MKIYLKDICILNNFTTASEDSEEEVQPEKKKDAIKKADSKYFWENNKVDSNDISSDDDFEADLQAAQHQMQQKAAQNSNKFSDGNKYKENSMKNENMAAPQKGKFLKELKY